MSGGEGHKQTHDESQWIHSEGARQQVIRLLRESGLMLERDLATACDQFAHANTNKRGVRVSSETLTYGTESDESGLRQLDRVVTLYKEFRLGERTGVQLQTHVCIEAKYRNEVELFSVRATPHRRPHLPVVGFIQGTGLQSAVSRLDLFQNAPIMSTSLIHIKGGKTPQGIHAENLVQKAGAAVYEFIRFDATDADAGSFGEDELKALHVLDRWKKYLQQTGYAPFGSVLRGWVNKNISDAVVGKFNNHVLPSRIYFGLTVYVPVMCFSGRLWEYSDDPPQQVPIVCTSLRLPGWPGIMKSRLISPFVEAPLLITNIEGVGSILGRALQVHLSVEERLKHSDPHTIERWPVEFALYRTIIGKVAKAEKRVRSDLFDVPF